MIIPKVFIWQLSIYFLFSCISCQENKYDLVIYNQTVVMNDLYGYANLSIDKLLYNITVATIKEIPNMNLQVTVNISAANNQKNSNSMRTFISSSFAVCDYLTNPFLFNPMFRPIFDKVFKNKKNHLYQKCPIEPVGIPNLNN